MSKKSILRMRRIITRKLPSITRLDATKQRRTMLTSRWAI